MSFGTVVPGPGWIFSFSRLFAFSTDFGDHSVKSGDLRSLVYELGTTSEYREEAVDLVHYASRMGLNSPESPEGDHFCDDEKSIEV